MMFTIQPFGVHVVICFYVMYIYGISIQKCVCGYYKDNNTMISKLVENLIDMHTVQSNITSQVEQAAGLLNWEQGHDGSQQNKFITASLNPFKCF